MLCIASFNQPQTKSVFTVTPIGRSLIICMLLSSLIIYPHHLPIPSTSSISTTAVLTMVSASKSRDPLVDQSLDHGQLWLQLALNGEDRHINNFVMMLVHSDSPSITTTINTFRPIIWAAILNQPVQMQSHSMFPEVESPTILTIALLESIRSANMPSTRNMSSTANTIVLPKYLSSLSLPISTILITTMSLSSTRISLAVCSSLFLLLASTSLKSSPETHTQEDQFSSLTTFQSSTILT